MLSCCEMKRAVSAPPLPWMGLIRSHKLSWQCSRGAAGPLGVATARPLRVWACPRAAAAFCIRAKPYLTISSVQRQHSGGCGRGSPPPPAAWPGTARADAVPPALVQWQPQQGNRTSAHSRASWLGAACGRQAGCTATGRSSRRMPSHPAGRCHVLCRHVLQAHASSGFCLCRHAMKPTHNRPCKAAVHMTWHAGHRQPLCPSTASWWRAPTGAG